jgi:uncharacterized membrane protein YedE/YeeE
VGNIRVQHGNSGFNNFGDRDVGYLRYALLPALPDLWHPDVSAMMETVFTPFQSLGGGLLIGLAAVLLMATMGRIMGATGILAGLLQPTDMADWSWRAAVLVGMICGPVAVMLLTGNMPVVQVPGSTAMLVVGGFIVGIGVTFGAGCTSGHGVCGMARLSPRSIAATITFMVATAITVYVVRHVLGA